MSQKYARETSLRYRAEQILNEKTGNLDSSWLDEISDLVHELQVRQLEIELQDEALLTMQHQLELAQRKYEDLYHSTPVGYFTLDEDGYIIEVNDTGAALLGEERENLSGTLFARFIVREDQEQYYFYHKNLLDTQNPQSDEMRMKRTDQSRFYAHLQGNAILADDEDPSSRFRIIVSDVTQRRQRHLIDTLLTAGHSLTTMVGLDDLLNLLVNTVTETLPSADAAILWLYNEENDMLVAHAMTGQPESNQITVHVPADEGLIGKVFQSGTYKYIEDVRNEPGFIPVGHRIHDLMQSALGVPLQSIDRPIGVLFAYNLTETRLFTSNDAVLLETLANQIALVIQNASFFRQISVEREQSRFLARQVVSAQENERRRIARELHDEVGQALTILKLELQLLQQKMITDLGAVHHDFDQSIELVDQTLHQVRNLSYLLRPPVLDVTDANTMLQSHCEEFASRTFIPVEYVGATLPPMTETVKITLYRFLQEALTNVVRHARASHIRVEASRSDETITLMVEDDGDGFDPTMVIEKVVEPRGAGLLGIRERLESIGGQLEILSIIGDGTHLVARVPLEEVTDDSCDRM